MIQYLLLFYTSELIAEAFKKHYKSLFKWRILYEQSNHLNLNETV